jgi:hypothetical protein
MKKKLAGKLSDIGQARKLTVVRSANRAAWADWTDGRLGLNPCPSFCGRVCDAQQPRRIRGRPCRQRWSRNFNGGLLKQLPMTAA